MAVITISRQYGSGGDEIASRVCEILGYRQFDKRLIAQAALESGISDHEIIDYSEENHRVRSFFERLFGGGQAVGQLRVWKEDPGGSRSTEDIVLTEEVAVTLVQKAIRTGYRQGNMVVVGRGGQVVLRDHQGVLHVRIEAPLEDRIQRVKEQFRQARRSYTADIDLRREAQDWILDRDAASADYIRRFYGENWNDPLLYHVVLNTGKLGLDQAAELISRLAVELRSPFPVPEAA